MKQRIKIIGPPAHDVGYRVFLLKNTPCESWDCLASRLITGQRATSGKLRPLVEGDDARLSAFRLIVEEKKPELAWISDILFEEHDGDIGRTGEYAMICSLVQAR